MTEYFTGIDIGSTMTKVVIMNDAKVIASVIGNTGPEHRKLANRIMEEALTIAGLQLDDIAYIVATGYGRINVPFADRQVTEISCHAKGVQSFFPAVKTIIDVGGQDCKGIKLNHGKIIDFVMNDKCAAGAGRFLEMMAESLGIKLEDMGKLSLTSTNEVAIASTCTVFAEQEVITKLGEGVALPDIVAGIHKSITTRIIGLVNRVKIEQDVVLTGGVARNIGLIKALETKLGYPVKISPEPMLTGAIGAAILANEISRDIAEKGPPVSIKRPPLQEATFFDG
jgi:predicted CoA-substrate-specific enzyme activase